MAGEKSLVKRKPKKVKKLDPIAQEIYNTRKELEQLVQSRDIEASIALYERLRAKSLPITTYIVQCVLSVASETESKDTQARVFSILEHAKSLPSVKIGETMYTQVVKSCAKLGDIAKGLAFLTELKDKTKVVPKLRTFSSLLTACKDANRIEEGFQLYREILHWELEPSEENYINLLELCCAARDSTRFYEILARFMDDILQPKESSWNVLIEWFTAFGWQHNIESVDDQGLCLDTKHQLKSIEMSETRHKLLLQQIETLACTNEKRTSQWSEFRTWLDKHSPENGYDAIIDAANVGYYHQNFTGGGFNYAQIQHLIDWFHARQQRVLVVLHFNRTRDSAVPEPDRQMVQEWKDKNYMFCCRPGNNDDWYWLYAAVWSKNPRTLLVTNDCMRDHHFSMLNPRTFLRWKERHQTTFDIKGCKTVILHQPSKYSKQSQQLDASWHFPALNSTQWLSFIQQE